MNYLYIIVTSRIFSFSANIQIMNWISNLFENHIFKSEYFKLLEVGLLIGCILFICLVYLIDYSKIIRLDYIKGHMEKSLKILLSMGTAVALSLMIFLNTIVYMMLILISYIVVLYGVSCIIEHHFEKENPKLKYKSQGI